MLDNVKHWWEPVTRERCGLFVSMRKLLRLCKPKASRQKCLRIRFQIYVDNHDTKESRNVTNRTHSRADYSVIVSSQKSKGSMRGGLKK